VKVEQIKAGNNAIAGKKAIAGEMFRLRLNQFGLSIGWMATCQKVERPVKLVDVAQSFPFSKWRREHLFQAKDGGTEMTDQVYCETSASSHK
jgi:ligand-binding SRPBCC domain-containing protein